jgi:hypothetical protein
MPAEGTRSNAPRYSGSGALQFAATAAVIRAERYRDHAAQLRQMAEADVAPSIRRQLLKLAGQFEAIAAIASDRLVRNRN